MIYEIQIPPVVRGKIQKCALNIAEDKPQVALEWYDNIYEKMSSLKEHPHRCPLAPENSHVEFELRHLLIGNYRVLFCVEDNMVNILNFKGGRENKPQ